MTTDELLRAAAEIEQDCVTLLGLPDALNISQIQHIEKTITNMARFSDVVKEKADLLNNRDLQTAEPGFQLRTFLTTAIGQPQIILYDFDLLLSEKQRNYLTQIIAKGEALSDLLTSMTT
jgi:hypothetical protein